MSSWGELAGDRPDLAGAVRSLMYQFGVGLAFLATTRPDGGPRVHPVCPLLTDDALFAFVVPSPKQADLRRDGRYALHSFPRPDDEDAAYLTGTATLVEDVEARRALAEQFVAERAALAAPAPRDGDALFAFDIERCLVTRTSGHGDPAPRHTFWRALTTS